MSKAKLTMQDIVNTIAGKAGVTKTAAEEFFRAWMAVTEEVLLADGQVKVRGFGTFRRVWMAPRKSVNVQTGEDILLDGYYRVVFVPDRELKERVNEPYAHLEPVVLDGESEAAQPVTEPDPLATLAEQADEIKGLLSEIRAMSAAAVPAGEVAARPEPAAPAADEPPAPEEETSPVEASPGDVSKEETPAREEKASPAATPQEEPSQPQETPPAPAETAPKDTPLPPPLPKRRTGWRVVLGVLAAAVVLTAAYFGIMPVQHWVNKVFLGYDTRTYDAVHERWEARQTAPAQSLPQSAAPVAADTFQQAFDSRFDHREYLATERLNPGSRLAHLADRYYGSPYFWVYIYEANREAIPDPDHVQVGTRVRIPKLPSLLIDPESPRAVEAALALREQYLKK